MRLLLSLGVFILFNGAVVAQCIPSLLPAPKKIEAGNGLLPLKKLIIHKPAKAGKDVQFALNELIKNIKERTGITLSTTTNPALATLKYTIQQKGRLIPEKGEMKLQSDRENYSITITPSQLQINAQTSSGLYYAVQTINQLITQNNNSYALPALLIEDSPAIPYRGIMMDFAHGGLLTIEEIKNQIDFLAKWKTNQYYFYNEVSIELDGYTSIAYKAGYTKKQVKEIIDYAETRHIDVVPFLNLYGHLHELIRKEKYADLAIGNYGHELNPDNPEVNKLLKNWIDQYSELFPSEFIHVGFDETWETKRIADETNNKINAEQLWLKQLSFVTSLLEEKGKTVMAWTDMNNYYPDVIKKLPPNVIPVIWEYSPDTSAINKFIKPVVKENKPFMIQPAVSGWGHIYPDVQYTYDNIRLCLNAGMQYSSPGFINSVWTDPVEPFVRPSWLFMSYGSVVAWQGKATAAERYSSMYAAVLYPGFSSIMKSVFDKLEETNINLSKCLGKNTGSMPRGTIAESWSNPFLPYYLKNTDTHLAAFKKARKSGEEAQDLLIKALKICPAKDSGMLNTLLVSAKLMTYSATRFIWAKNISDRWNSAMLKFKNNDFVYYDLVYLCHSLLTDMTEEITELKQEYQQNWAIEYLPYRMQSIVSRFDVEFGLWRKLFLKVIDYRIENGPVALSNVSFAELFKPDF